MKKNDLVIAGALIAGGVILAKKVKNKGIGSIKVKTWHWTRKEDAIPDDGNVLIAMPGHSVSKDFYLSIPENGLYFKTANNNKHGSYMSKMFMDGEYIGVTRMSKKNKIQQLYNAGYKEEAVEYALGYRHWQETRLGGERIIARKEAARQSHKDLYYGDLKGEFGHNMRQHYRRSYLRKNH